MKVGLLKRYLAWFDDDVDVLVPIVTYPGSDDWPPDVELISVIAPMESAHPMFDDCVLLPSDVAIAGETLEQYAGIGDGYGKAIALMDEDRSNYRKG